MDPAADVLAGERNKVGLVIEIGILELRIEGYRLGALGVALDSYAVPTADLADASQEDRDAFAAQLRNVFARPAPVPDLPTPLTAAAQ